MTIERTETAEEFQKQQLTISMDRHGRGYREDFEKNSDEFHAKCPVAWNDTHGGYWYVSGIQELFNIARRGADVLSNDADIHNERRGYTGVQIPPAESRATIGGFLEMDPPDQPYYRKALNPYLSPAAVQRWQPILDELTRACIDEKIESGQIDFVDDLANIVPAVLTMALLGFPLEDWEVYCEPIHAGAYTSPDSADYPRILDLSMKMGTRAFESIAETKQTRKPGLVDALIRADIGGKQPSDMDLIGVVILLIAGGFDTTTALTAHSFEWLSEHPDERDWLSRERETLLDSATEEFLRFYTPAVGDGRTVCADAEIGGVQFKEGDRLWLSWAMANRDEQVFHNPHEVHLDRTGNRHASFGLGIHRCIGSNVARAAFKTMLRHVLDRMPDYTCDPAGAVHYDTTGVINGMKHLTATFTPGKRLGPGLEETIAALQKTCDEQGLAEPVTKRNSTED